MNKRFIVLVIDGLGVGAMKDVTKLRPQDKDANTFAHIYPYTKKTKLFLTKAGISSFYLLSKKSENNTLLSIPFALGKCALEHYGADSYMGHQEIVGSKPTRPIRQFVRDMQKLLIQKLNEAGHTAFFNGSFLVVNSFVAVSDNIETDYGINISIVGCTDYISFAEIQQIGRIVRKNTNVGRVITMGGSNITPQSFFNHFYRKKRGGYEAWGIDVPGLKIYNDSYQVEHMGNVNPSCQTPYLLTRKGIAVTLVGKAADIIKAQGATLLPMVNTKQTIETLINLISSQKNGLIIANIQETDLAGHEQNPKRYGSYINLIDTMLPVILKLLNKEDVLLLCGDHGNDPTIGHSNHTREYTPLIVFSHKICKKYLHTRKTLSDIGASISHFFGVSLPENGTPILFS